MSLSKILNTKIAPEAASWVYERVWLVISHLHVAPCLRACLRVWMGALRTCNIALFPVSAIIGKVVYISKILSYCRTCVPRTRLSCTAQPRLCSLLHARSLASPYSDDSFHAAQHSPVSQAPIIHSSPVRFQTEISHFFWWAIASDVLPFHERLVLIIAWPQKLIY